MRDGLRGMKKSWSRDSTRPEQIGTPGEPRRVLGSNSLAPLTPLAHPFETSTTFSLLIHHALPSLLSPRNNVALTQGCLSRRRG